MAIKITDVQIEPQITTTGKAVSIYVTAIDTSWLEIKQDYTNWGSVMNKFKSWLELKDKA